MSDKGLLGCLDSFFHVLMDEKGIQTYHSPGCLVVLLLGRALWRRHCRTVAACTGGGTTAHQGVGAGWWRGVRSLLLSDG